MVVIDEYEVPNHVSIDHVNTIMIKEGGYIPISTRKSLDDSMQNNREREAVMETRKLKILSTEVMVKMEKKVNRLIVRKIMAANDVMTKWTDKRESRWLQRQ